MTVFPSSSIKEVSSLPPSLRSCSRSILSTLSIILSYLTLTVSGMSASVKSSSILEYSDSNTHPAAVRRCCSLRTVHCVLPSPCYLIRHQPYKIRYVLDITLWDLTVVLAVVNKPFAQRRLLAFHLFSL